VLLVRSYFKQFVNTRLSRNMRNSFRVFFFFEKDSHDIPNATRFINAKYIFIANSRSSKRKIDYLSLGLLPPPARASFPDHATPDTFAHRVDPSSTSHKTAACFPGSTSQGVWLLKKSIRPSKIPTVGSG
jgi:hypothetical protein